MQRKEIAREGERDEDRKWESARRRLMDVSMKVGGGGVLERSDSAVSRRKADDG